MAISFTFESTDMVRTLKIPKPASRIMSETVIAADNAQGKEELQVACLAFLPADRVVLEERLEMRRQSRRAFRIAQFIDDHRGRVGLCEKTLRDLRVRVDAAGIDRAHAAARDRRDGETPVFAARRKQLNGIARRDIEELGQLRTDDERSRDCRENLRT